MSDYSQPLALAVDELAASADTPVTTIRMYQHRGLIPPPTKQGRRAIYDQRHVDRLALIAHLQRRGHNLAAIGDAIDTWNQGGTLAGFLDTDDLLPGLAPEPVRLPFAELATRFAETPLSQHDVQRAVGLGLLRLTDDGEVELPIPAYGDIGPAVAAAGVPVEVILDEYEQLTTSVDTITERFAAVFETHVWRPFVDRGASPDELPELTSTARQLADLATHTVVQLLRVRFAHLVDDRLSELDRRPPG